VVVACLEWLDAHQPDASVGPLPGTWSQQMRALPKNLLQLGARKGVDPFDRFSVPAKEALSLAQEEARKHGQADIKPEDLLLGLLRVQSGFAATALPQVGISAPMVETQMASSADNPSVEALIPSARIKAIIGTAFALASDLQHRCVGTGHLLHALVSQADGVVAVVFKEKGITMETMTAETNRLRGTVGLED
jgi:ATP-dependent Clp protease ATP-binding subunit ClpC